MNDPGYDFFAIGGPNDPATAPPPEGQLPIAPSPVPPVVGATYHSPPPARTFQMGDMTVNQFGTPVELPAVPTGPYAAPGMGTAPAPVPGLVTTWQGPAGSAGRQGAPGRRTAAAPHSDLPRNVRAVAILALVFGVLLMIGTFRVWSAYTELRALLDERGGTDPLATALLDDILTAALVGVVILAFVTVFLLVGGGAALANKRWGGWMLVVTLLLYLFFQVWEHLHNLAAFSFGAIIATGCAIALLCALLTGDGRRWLMDES